MKRKHLWFAIPLLVLLIIPGSWLLWFHTRPVYDEEKWNKMTSSPPEFILYLFDPTPANAVRVLRDGLMNELARSGKLPLGYPKLVEASWDDRTPRCHDKNLLSGGRYFIQLSETPDNYIEIPLCPRTAMEAYLPVYVLPAWPWMQVDDTTPEIIIGLERGGSPEKRHILKPGQEEPIMKSLENMGIKLYLDEYFHYDSKYGK